VDEPGFSGQWRQVSSSTSACDSCFIGIAAHGRVLTISSNNGWSGFAESPNHGYQRFAEGSGGWEKSAGVPTGERFNLHLALKDNQLLLVLEPKPGSGRAGPVVVVFERPPQTLFAIKA
jgi:hypothetical protein